MQLVFHILAAAATVLHIVLNGLLLALLLSASAPDAALAATVLKLVGLTLFVLAAGACVWLWARHHWAILAVPLLGATSQVGVVYAGNALLSWTIQFGPAP